MPPVARFRGAFLLGVSSHQLSKSPHNPIAFIHRNSQVVCLDAAPAYHPLSGSLHDQLLPPRPLLRESRQRNPHHRLKRHRQPPQRHLLQADDHHNVSPQPPHFNLHILLIRQHLRRTRNRPSKSSHPDPSNPLDQLGRGLSDPSDRHWWTARNAEYWDRVVHGGLWLDGRNGRKSYRGSVVGEQDWADGRSECRNYRGGIGRDCNLLVFLSLWLEEESSEWECRCFFVLGMLWGSMLQEQRLIYLIPY